MQPCSDEDLKILVSFLQDTCKVKCWLLSSELIKNYVYIYKPLSCVQMSLYVHTAHTFLYVAQASSFPLLPYLLSVINHFTALWCCTDRIRKLLLSWRRASFLLQWMTQCWFSCLIGQWSDGSWNALQELWPNLRKECHLLLTMSVLLNNNNNKYKVINISFENVVEL